MSDSSGGGLSDLDDINDLEMIMQQVQSEQEQEEAAERVRYRNYIYRQRLDVAERLMADYFGPNPKYPLYYFRKRYRMSRKLFLEIVSDEEHMLDFYDNLNGDQNIDDYDMAGDTSSTQARVYKDIQGIPWERLNITREGIQHKSRKGGKYYEFFHNTRLVKPTILHLQDLVWATSKHDVYVTSNSGNVSPIEIILIEDVTDVGKKGQLLDVKARFYRNFLHPSGKARIVTTDLIK
ncbi:uncharacterized WD repeat-containing protein-like protein isoform X2 [Tanacetum coccineum]